MILKEGNAMPEFRGITQNGTPFNSSELNLWAKSILLYPYSCANSAYVSGQLFDKSNYNDLIMNKDQYHFLAYINDPAQNNFYEIELNNQKINN